MKFGSTGILFPKHLAAFKRMHNRVRDGKVPSIQWPREEQGLCAFVEEVGPWPTHLKKPSVGRVHHDRGYEHGNVQFEEHAVNSVKRRGTKHQHELGDVEFKKVMFRHGSAEHKEHQRKASLARWAKPGQRELASARSMGNQHARRSK